MVINKGLERRATPNKPPRYIDGTLSNSMTEVVVGPEREKFVINTDLLRHSSSRFDAEFDITISELLELPNVSPTVFRIFLDWMRSDGDQMPDWSAREPHHAPVEPAKLSHNRDALAHYYSSQPEAEALECYMFAVEYGIRLFKNDLFDCIVQMNPEGDLVPSYGIVLRVWAATTPAPLMRKYLIDVFARNWTHDIHESVPEECRLRDQIPADFWLSILCLRDKSTDLIDEYAPWEENLCQYHDHTGDEEGSCYWQRINDGEGYCTDYSDFDSDESMLDEYEADFIDDTGLDSDEEPQTGSLQPADARNTRGHSQKGGYDSSSSGETEVSLTL